MPLLTVVAGVLAAWLGLSVLAAVGFGQAVRLADRRRPRAATRSTGGNAISAPERVAERDPSPGRLSRREAAGARG